MIYSFQLKTTDWLTFHMFMTDWCPIENVEFKIVNDKSKVISTMSIRQGGNPLFRIKKFDKLVLFRDRITCETVEMTWLMMRDEIRDRRDPVSLAV